MNNKFMATVLATFLFYNCASGLDDFDESNELSDSQASNKLNRFDLMNILIEQGARSEDAKSILDAIEQSQEREIAIDGFLATSGFNGALFIDTDTWDFDATIVAPESGEQFKVEDMFEGKFKNGGLKIELGYKWLLMIPTNDVSLASLDGAIYGRGIGVTVEAGIGLELGWMPGKNRPGHMFIISPKIGIGGGFVFPAVEFKSKVE